MASFLQKLQELGGQETLPQPEHLGCIRVVLVGNSGVGKTALTELIATGKPARSTRTTAGCNVSVTLFEETVGMGDDVEHNGMSAAANGAAASFANGMAASAAAVPLPPKHKFFVELWDVSGHPSYAELRRLFYRSINGVVLVYDLCAKGSLTRLPKWAAEVAAEGSFVAPFPDDVAAHNIGGLPVPVLVIGNKADRIPCGAAASSTAGSIPTRCGPLDCGSFNRSGSFTSSSFQKLCGSWLGGRRAVRDTSEANLPDLQTLTGLDASAVAGQLDRAAVRSFFTALWARRYRQSGRLGSSSQLYVQSVGEAPRQNGPGLMGPMSSTDMDRRLDDDWV